MAINISIDLVLGYLITIFKFIFKLLAGFISGLSVDFGKALLLIISAAISWYFANQVEKGKIRKLIVVIILSLLLFLTFIFSLGGN